MISPVRSKWLSGDHIIKHLEIFVLDVLYCLFKGTLKGSTNIIIIYTHHDERSVPLLPDSANTPRDRV